MRGNSLQAELPLTTKADEKLGRPRVMWARFLDEELSDLVREYQLPSGDILGERRTLSVMRVRQELYWRLRQRGLSYPEIGELLGRDHTSIMWGCARHERRMRGTK